MDLFNLLQEFTPAQAMVTMLLLPWLAVALMHAASSVAYLALDDNFSAHAEAALRWGAQAPGPVTPTPIEAVAYRARAAVRVRVAQHAGSRYLENEAA
ncbi:MAG: hypothetical protein WDN04_03895 [Rhodospirillales bacterium]